MIRVTVLYPAEAGKQFDHDYYVTKHMKLVRDRLAGFGLVRTEVARGLRGGRAGSPAPYACIGHLYFDSLDAMEKGMGQHGKEFMADMPSFTNVRPQMQVDEVIG